MFFFFNDTATTEIYTLSLHDALPISQEQHRFTVGNEPAGGQLADLLRVDRRLGGEVEAGQVTHERELGDRQDRKSTRLNSSHANISYAVFCLKKKHRDQHSSNADFLS